MQGNGETVEGAKGRILRKEDTYVILGSGKLDTTGPKPEYSFATDKNGKWSANNLPDGSYVIQVTPGSTDPDQKRDQQFAVKKQLMSRSLEISGFVLYSK